MYALGIAPNALARGQWAANDPRAFLGFLRVLDALHHERTEDEEEENHGERGRAAHEREPRLVTRGGDDAGDRAEHRARPVELREDEVLRGRLAALHGSIVPEA